MATKDDTSIVKLCHHLLKPVAPTKISDILGRAMIEAFQFLTSAPELPELAAVKLTYTLSTKMPGQLVCSFAFLENWARGMTYDNRQTQVALMVLKIGCLLCRQAPQFANLVLVKIIVPYSLLGTNQVFSETTWEVMEDKIDEELDESTIVWFN